MTQPPEPSHSGLRPLGPYGEGYCRVCHFVVALTLDGVLERHARGAQLDSNAECSGSFLTPPKVTPYSSRKAAFAAGRERVLCRVCSRGVTLLADGRMSPHSSSPVRLVRCSGSNERG